jgi:signal transduction histidine kinase/CheY-like chemotaxis protein
MRETVIYRIPLVFLLIILPVFAQANSSIPLTHFLINNQQEQFIVCSLQLDVLSSQAMERSRVEHPNLMLIILTSITFLLLVFSIAILFKLNRSKQHRFSGFNLPDDIKNQNQSMQKSIEELKATIKNVEEIIAQKNSFISNMSLEIRTQIKSIVGFNKMLVEDDLPNETRQHYINIINKRGENLLSALNNIIYISQIDAGSLEVTMIPFNLHQLLNHIHTRFCNDKQNKMKEGVALKLMHPTTNLKNYIISDPNLIEQILINLLDNALKSTVKGNIEFGYKIEMNQSIQFFVKDTGIGIPETDIKLVYNKFHRVKRAHKGSSAGNGLGLSVCKGMVEVLGGKIWFDSLVNKETTFYFTIPFIPAEIFDKTSNASTSPFLKNDYKDKIILVVEDDLNSYQFIEALLSETNARIIHAKNGEDGVEICKLVDNIDLVLMDMQLPFINGYEATNQIKAINPNIAIIAQTAHVMNDDRAKCLNAGCDDYIPKPIDPDDFFRLLNHYLSKASVSG